jgi:integrase/recombinase XerC
MEFMESERFLQYIKDERRLSCHTVIAYKNDLSQFFSFIKEFEIIGIEKINHSIIRYWIVNLIENNISNRSINRKLSTLKSFYKYLIKEGVMIENPMYRVLTPKTSKRLPVFVEEISMNLLFEEVDFGCDFRGIRDKLIIELFYATGMRLNELINIKIADLDRDLKNLKVLGKRNKERILPLNTILINSISTYLLKRKEINFKSDYMFVTNKGEKIYEKLVYRLVNSYLSKVTTITKKSPHVLRHTFATHMLNNGAELNAIKEILGHSNLSATQVYTHNSIEKLKLIYKQAHPKA